MSTSVGHMESAPRSVLTPKGVTSAPASLATNWNQTIRPAEPLVS